MSASTTLRRVGCARWTSSSATRPSLIARQSSPWQVAQAGPSLCPRPRHLYTSQTWSQGERQPAHTYKGKATQPIDGATDLSHAHFIASASPHSDFNPDQTPLAGQDLTRSSAPPPAPSGKDDPQDGSPGSQTTSAEGIWLGKLSPTSSHLFKLLLPLPSSNGNGSTLGRNAPPRLTAFLLHPSQPLSHLSRLIVGSLPPSFREAEITFLSLTGHASDLDSHLRNAEEQDERDLSGRQEGGPYLGERSEDQGRWQEVSWSQSTDLSDFIKQSCLNEKFKIVIAPSSDQAKEQIQSLTKGDERELIMEVVIPSFASRTHYIRSRLLTLTRELDRMTKQKKDIDYKAHKGAQRLAVVALGGGVAYWGTVIRYTFFTDAGWDLMEPVTWATGFAALLSSAAFLIYHNREVSYSSLLDLSISARQRKLYGEAGLDIERWTEMVAEAKTLRREISRIAADYDIEWRGELENLESARAQNVPGGHVQASARPAGSGQAASHSSTSNGRGADRPKAETREGPSLGPRDEAKLDIDATISEAADLAEKSEASRSQENANRRTSTSGSGSGEPVEPRPKGESAGSDDRGSRARKGEEKESDSELRGRKKAKEVIDGARG
ncbi:hypothetical protein IAU60_004317 [Kwoniella sp. DSM 27419]